MASTRTRPPRILGRQCPRRLTSQVGRDVADDASKLSPAPRGRGPSRLTHAVIRARSAPPRSPAPPASARPSETVSRARSPRRQMNTCDRRVLRSPDDVANHARSLGECREAGSVHHRDVAKHIRLPIRQEPGTRSPAPHRTTLPMLQCARGRASPVSTFSSRSTRLPAQFPPSGPRTAAAAWTSDGSIIDARLSRQQADAVSGATHTVVDSPAGFFFPVPGRRPSGRGM